MKRLLIAALACVSLGAMAEQDHVSHFNPTDSAVSNDIGSRGVSSNVELYVTDTGFASYQRDTAGNRLCEGTMSYTFDAFESAKAGEPMYHVSFEVECPASYLRAPTSIAVSNSGGGFANNGNVFSDGGGNNRALFNGGDSILVRQWQALAFMNIYKEAFVEGWRPWSYNTLGCNARSNGTLIACHKF